MPTYMYVSVQDDDKVVQFGMDPETGKLNREAEYALPGGHRLWRLAPTVEPSMWGTAPAAKYPVTR
jgi:hypothetical protein